MSETADNNRLETFCDGIFAIAITLLILEIKVPSFESVHSSGDLKYKLINNWPSWLAFMLSFISMFIAWVNHHHFFKQINKTSNIFIYANGLLMLTVIVYPFVTSLLAEYLNTAYAQLPVFFYCFLNLIHASAWVFLCHAALHPRDLTKSELYSKRMKGTRRSILFTVVFNTVMCFLAIWLPIVAVCLTALAWIVYLIMGIVLTPME